MALGFSGVGLQMTVGLAKRVATTSSPAGFCDKTAMFSVQRTASIFEVQADQ